MTDNALFAGVTAHLTIVGGRAEDAIAFYQAAFGADELRRMASEDGRLMHAHLWINGGSIMLHDDFPEHDGPTAAPSAVTLHLEVVDADAAFDRAVAAGAVIRMPLADQFWGDRYGEVEDPFGFRWAIGAPVSG